jgi:hypothetical protein
MARCTNRPTHLVMRGKHAARRAPLRAGGLDNTAGSGLHQTFEELTVLLEADAENVTRLHARRRGVVAGAIFGAMPHVHDPRLHEEDAVAGLDVGQCLRRKGCERMLEGCVGGSKGIQGGLRGSMKGM